VCCFTGQVRQVSATNIFARAFPDGSELLAYGMTVGFDDAVAMVLPIPTPPGTGEGFVRFVDMASCPSFFEELGALFPDQFAFGAPLDLAPQPASPAFLRVHSVGDFEASFVPAIADFQRLDPRFRMSDAIWRALPEYADFGFAVFKLKRAAEVQRIHPMAFVFPRRDPDAIFFPTVHVHDGAVHDTTRFDHTLYFQPERSWEPFVMATRASRPTREIGDEASRFADTSAPMFREIYGGDLPNQDVWLRGDVLRGRCHLGEQFCVRVNVTNEFLLGGGRGRPTDPGSVQPHVWREVSTPESERRRARDIAGSVFSAALAARGAVWGAMPLQFDLPALGGFGPPPLGGRTAENGGLVTVFDYARRVFGINATVALRAAPSQNTMAEIRAVLREAIARIDG
jgi:hypothetical protein